MPTHLRLADEPAQPRTLAKPLPCPICGGVVGESSSMRGTRARIKYRRRKGVTLATVCHDCHRSIRLDGGKSPSLAIASIVFDQPTLDIAKCRACGIFVALHQDPRRKLHVCSTRCRLKLYTQPGAVLGNGMACHGCGRSMAGRENRKYCSDACRQRAYRERDRARRGD